MKANIEKLKDSVIDHNVGFNCGGFKMKEVVKFRKANMRITQMCWITKRPTMDCGYTLSNPRSLIMIILN